MIDGLDNCPKIARYLSSEWLSIQLFHYLVNKFDKGKLIQPTFQVLVTHHSLSVDSQNQAGIFNLFSIIKNIIFTFWRICHPLI